MSKRPNEVRFEGDVAYIALSRRSGEIVETAIDAADVDRVLSLGVRWRAYWCPNTRQYRVSTMAKQGDKRRTIILHRFLLGATGRFEFVDHIDGDALNNTRRNLRIVTPQQNEQNRRGAPRNSSTGVKNVRFRPDTGRYTVTVSHGGHNYSFGCFASLPEAATAACAARKQMHSHCRENSVEEHVHARTLLEKAAREVAANG